MGGPTEQPAYVATDAAVDSGASDLEQRIEKQADRLASSLLFFSYTSEVPEDLLCPGCNEAVIEPRVMCVEEGHLICSTCVSSVSSPACLACQVEIATDAAGSLILENPSRTIVRMLEKLSVSCCGDKCEWQGARGQLLDHRRHSCTSFECPNGCGSEGTAEQMSRHDLVDCSLAEVPCPLGCPLRLLRKDVPAHVLPSSSACPALEGGSEADRSSTGREGSLGNVSHSEIQTWEEVADEEEEEEEEEEDERRTSLPDAYLEILVNSTSFWVPQDVIDGPRCNGSLLAGRQGSVRVPAGVHAMETLLPYLLHGTLPREEEMSRSQWQALQRVARDLGLAEVTRQRRRPDAQTVRALLARGQRDFKKYDLSGLDLSGCDFSFACLRRADLSHACLSHVNLTEADLSSAKLVGCAMESTNLTGTILTDADTNDVSFVSSPPSVMLDASFDDRAGEFSIGESHMQGDGHLSFGTPSRLSRWGPAFSPSASPASFSGASPRTPHATFRPSLARGSLQPASLAPASPAPASPEQVPPSPASPSSPATPSSPTTPTAALDETETAAESTPEKADMSFQERMRWGNESSPLPPTTDTSRIRPGDDCRFLNLLGADLAGRDLSHCNFIGANLRGTNLAKSILKGAHMNHAHLNGANLALADMTGARLVHADMAGANLQGANLSFAELSQANFIDANVSGAKFACANVSSVHFFGDILKVAAQK